MSTDLCRQSCQTVTLQRYAGRSQTKGLESMAVAVGGGLQWLYVHDAGALEKTPRFQRGRKCSAEQDTQYGASQRWRKAAC